MKRPIPRAHSKGFGRATGRGRAPIATAMPRSGPGWAHPASVRQRELGAAVGAGHDHQIRPRSGVQVVVGNEHLHAAGQGAEQAVHPGREVIIRGVNRRGPVVDGRRTRSPAMRAAPGWPSVPGAPPRGCRRRRAGGGCRHDRRGHTHRLFGRSDAIAVGWEPPPRLAPAAPSVRSRVAAGPSRLPSPGPCFPRHRRPRLLFRAGGDGAGFDVRPGGLPVFTLAVETETAGGVGDGATAIGIAL